MLQEEKKNIKFSNPCQIKDNYPNLKTTLQTFNLKIQEKKERRK
jgi:hypothetical protein